MSPDSNRYFTSRIIVDLGNKIRDARSATDRNVLYAQKAFALARHSLIPEARAIVSELRRINSSYEARLAAWIMFAEGIIEHSETNNLPRSKDRILRAHLVGQAANDPTLAATAAAWLAQFSLLEGKYLESKDYLMKAFRWSQETDSEARSRASIVLGCGFSYAGEVDKAKVWFQRARDHAVRSGDIAMQNIVLFNASAFHTTHLTLLDCKGSVDPAELNFAVMSARSASNLNTALGIANQPSMPEIQRAELLTIERKWNDAIEIFNRYIEQSKVEGQSRLASKFYAHRAWCKANVAAREEARHDFHLAVESADENYDPDDRAVLHFRLAHTARILSDSTLAAEHEALGESYLTLHTEHQKLVRKYLDEVVDEILHK